MDFGSFSSLNSCWVLGQMIVVNEKVALVQAARIREPIL
jgi:hypothetical protein